MNFILNPKESFSEVEEIIWEAGFIEGQKSKQSEIDVQKSLIQKLIKLLPVEKLIHLITKKF